jgi:hypothetical protein
VLGLVLVIFLLTMAGARRWTHLTRKWIGALQASRLDVSAQQKSVTRYDSRELDGLPAPVQRYFRAALTEGQPMVTAVTMQQVGTINMSATGEQRMPFTASPSPCNSHSPPSNTLIIPTTTAIFFTFFCPALLRGPEGAEAKRRNHYKCDNRTNAG